jgi:hypothetical protein
MDHPSLFERKKMRAVKKLKNIIKDDPSAMQSKIYTQLILMLESDDSNPLQDLYKLDQQEFDLALSLLKEWRIDRFYVGKSKVFDMAFQANQFNT